jgi:hypothetical protein
LPWELANQTRPLLPVFPRHRSILVESRSDQYFASYPSRPLKEPYQGAAAFVREQRLHDVGMMLPYDPFEYELWVVLKQVAPDVKLEYVDVRNISSTTATRSPSASFRPEAIIHVQSVNEEARAAELHLAGSVYLKQWSSGAVDVYVAEPGTARQIPLEN